MSFKTEDAKIKPACHFVQFSEGITASEVKLDINSLPSYASLKRIEVKGITVTLIFEEDPACFTIIRR